MKKITVTGLFILLIGVMFYAGINGIANGHATGKLFIFLAACTSAGFVLDMSVFLKQRIRKSRVRKLGR